MLRCENPSAAVETTVLSAARSCFGDLHEGETLSADFEHGQWWITCVPCGAQWSVNDASGPGSFAGFDFERVTHGDGSCEEGS